MPFHKLNIKQPKHSKATETPYKVVSVRAHGEQAIGVISNSHLFNSEDRDTYEEENFDWGLLEDDFSAGYFDCPELGEKIWLQITLNAEDQGIESIDVMHGNVYSNGWETYPDPIKINNNDPDNPFQQYYMQIIAEVTDPQQDPRPGFIISVPYARKVVQLLNANLMMTTAMTTNDADQPDLPLLIALQMDTAPGTSTDGSGDEIPSDPDLMTPWRLGSDDTGNQYDFEIFNESDEDGAKVTILDGVVYTANNEGVSPDGMPSNNTYVIPVDDGDEIWVGFTYENHFSYEITSCWIDHGAETPDNDPENNIAYVTIGHVEVDINEPDGIDVVYPTNEVCGDIFWEPPRFDVHFDFQLEDASEDQTAKIRIYDGVVYTANNEGVNPDGMPSNNEYIIEVQDTYEVWVGFIYENHLNYEIVQNGCWIDTGPQTPDDDPVNNTAYVTLGHIDVNYSGEENIAQVYPINEVCGDIFWEPPRFDVHFDFQIEDASDGSNPLVRIYDGVVYTANNDGADPDGMPSNNNYIIGVNDGDEIWVGFTYENDLNFEVTSCWIDRGSQTPDDDPENNIAYVTLGHVDVNYSGEENIAQVYPIQEVCGDIFWQPPSNTNHYNFELEDASEGSTALVLIRDGSVIGCNDDPIDPDGMPSDNTYILPVNDGDEIWVGVLWDLETDDGVSGDNIISVWIDRGSETPDDDYLTQYITLGHVDVNYSGDENIATVYGFNETLGDIIIQYPPPIQDGGDQLKLCNDKDTGNIVWKADIPDPPDDGIWILGVEDGDVQWFDTDDCGD